MSDATDHLISIRPIRPEDVAALNEAAAKDNHVVAYPTHVVRKGGAVVGYLSVMAMPVVDVWLSSTEMTPRLSIQAISTGESIAAEHGARTMVLPCAGTSPFLPLLPRLGWKKLGDVSMHVKTL